MDWNNYIGVLKKYSQYPRVKSYITVHHHDRIKHSIAIIEKYMKLTKDTTMLELGTTFPFYAAYFKEKYNITPVISNRIAETGIPYSMYNMEYKKINLCSDEISDQYDLIICQEVIEHLPCNLYKVRDKIVQALKINGYLCSSIYLGGVKVNIESDKPSEYNKEHGHIKTFPNAGTVIKFYTVDELELLEHKEVKAWGRSYFTFHRRIK